MRGLLAQARDFASRLSVFRGTAPVNDTESFGRFLAEKAAFVSQKKLYEYIKTRMGMTYPEHFANDTFIASVNVAKWRVYAACLSDLALYMAARLAAETGNPDAALALARHAHDATVAERFDAKEMRGDPGEIVADFAKRSSLVNLSHAAEGENAFQLSPKELVRWAPIAEELKRYDTDIVINSLRFAWLAVREDFRRALDARAVMMDWTNQSGSSRS